MTVIPVTLALTTFAKTMPLRIAFLVNSDPSVGM